MILTGSCLCGRVAWTFSGIPEGITACNCTACRRYGTLWAYDYEGEGISTSGETRAYLRENAELGFHFCPECGCLAWWRALQPNAEGRRRIAVNMRLIQDPEPILNVPIDHFDGYGEFTDLPRDGRTVRDLWF